MAVKKRTAAFFLCGILLSISVFVGAPASFAAILTVANTNDTGAGSLRQAVQDAASGDVVDFDEALFESGPVTITLSSGQLEIGKALEISGPGADKLTISGNSQSRIFLLGENASMDISGLRLTGGDTSADTSIGGYGGAIFSYGKLALSDVAVEDNFAPEGGGGLYSTGGNLAIERCRFSGNATMIDVNAGRAGGGIYHFDGTFLLKDTLVEGNSAVRGGGLYLYICGTKDALVEGCAFSGNSARGGGGAMVEGYPGSSGVTVFRNSTFYGNDANEGGSTSGGGGVWSWNSEGPVRFENCTITRNSAGGYGAGVRVSGLSVAFKNSIVYQNILTNVNASFYRDLGQDASIVTDEGYNIIGMSFNNSFSWAATTLYDDDGTVPYNEIQSGIDVRLQLLADNGGPTPTCALLPGSVAIDAIPDSQGFPGLDQRGFARGLSGTGADIGAFEVQGPSADFGNNGMDDVNEAITESLSSGGALPIEGLAVEFGAVSGWKAPFSLNGQEVVFVTGGLLDEGASSAEWAEGASGVVFETSLGGAAFTLVTSGDPTGGDTGKVGAVLVRVALTLTSADLSGRGLSSGDIEALFDGSVSDDVAAGEFFDRFSAFKAFTGADPALDPVDLVAFIKDDYGGNLSGSVEFSRDLDNQVLSVGLVYVLLDESPAGDPLSLEDIGWSVGGENREGLLFVYDGSRDGQFRDPVVLGEGTLQEEEDEPCSEGSGGCNTGPLSFLSLGFLVPLFLLKRKNR
jgi:hypothetical protein